MQTLKVWGVLLVTGCLFGMTGCVSLIHASHKLNRTQPPSYFYLSDEPEVAVGLITTLPSTTIDPSEPMVALDVCEMKANVDTSPGRVFPELPHAMWLRLGSESKNDISRLTLVEEIRPFKELAFWGRLVISKRELERLNTALTTRDFLRGHPSLTQAQIASLLAHCTTPQNTENLYMLSQLLTGEVQITFRSFFGFRRDISGKLDRPEFQPLLARFSWDKTKRQLVSRRRWVVARVSQPLLLQSDAYICNADSLTHKCIVLAMKR